MKKSNSLIKIIFEINKEIKFNNSSLSIYLENDESWLLFPKKSKASFKNSLIKINDKNNKEIFLFLETATMESNDDSIIIELYDQPKFYFVSKNFIDIKQEISNQTKVLNYLEAKENISLNVDEIIEINNIKNTLFKLKMIQKFKLSEGEINE
ncbi:Uncharacterised protein [Mycoplasmopsis maculosa]|uniref:Uncharacterized protein n=1 Tax=Mycoplasmopsis maculosa TaxID=114885 RepID=A0A449B548_9BACT|nr:hypothetical protein [Mycoplasmopsis maculosa]VEU75720.1 Uncharacterised protein [Mycoplasmopsis maculosa]